ncbi:MAG: hypothetical protein HOZ81_46485 [Streptomyces sp.]|nr:hypothetical protein [Streptomyces sp.]
MKRADAARPAGIRGRHEELRPPFSKTGGPEGETVTGLKAAGAVAAVGEGAAGDLSVEDGVAA